jgi:hypothetical protein
VARLRQDGELGVGDELCDARGPLGRREVVALGADDERRGLDATELLPDRIGLTIAGARPLSNSQRRSASASPGTSSGWIGCSLRPKPGRSGAKKGRRVPSALISGFRERLEEKPWTSTIGVVSSSGAAPFYTPLRRALCAIPRSK